MIMGNLSIFWDLQFLISGIWSSSTCLVRVTPRYFVLFVTTVKCGFPNFFLCLFILCIKEGYWLVELILYPATLLKMFINCRVLLIVGVLGVAYIICNKWFLDFFLSNLYPFDLSCCVTALVRTLSTVLNK